VSRSENIAREAEILEDPVLRQVGLVFSLIRRRGRTALAFLIALQYCSCDNNFASAVILSWVGDILTGLFIILKGQSSEILIMFFDIY
jgi:hypothetical protein